MIGVIDYRAGNAPSVMYALARLGLEGTVGEGDVVRADWRKGAIQLAKK